MYTLKEKASDFLAQKRIAVAGVSRTKPEAANGVYKKLRDHGYEVFAINPNAEEVEGNPAYPDLKSIPGGVDALFISTRPSVTDVLVRECAEVGISRVWMHRSVTPGAVSNEAVAFCEENGIMVIPGACPMMFLEPDFGHKCMKVVLGWMGKLPK